MSSACMSLIESGSNLVVSDRERCISANVCRTSVRTQSSNKFFLTDDLSHITAHSGSYNKYVKKMFL